MATTVNVNSSLPLTHYYRRELIFYIKLAVVFVGEENEKQNSRLP